MKEAQIQKEIISYLQILENQGILIYYRTGVGMIKTAQGRVFKTGRPGAPDITMCYKGRYVGIEVKRSKGVQSSTQKAFEKRIEIANGFYVIVTSVADTIQKLKDIDKQISHNGNKNQLNT